jgi:hypothetical protein
MAPAAGTTVLSDKSDATATTMNQPVSGNLLDNASVPPGKTVTVTGFAVEGSNQVLLPGSGPVALSDPTTGEPVGTLVLRSDGSYTFTPAPNYVGPVPAIDVTLRTTDGSATITSSLTIDVLPRECAQHA